MQPNQEQENRVNREEAWNPCNIHHDPRAQGHGRGAGPSAKALADWPRGPAGALAPLLRVSARGLLKDATGRVVRRGLRREVDGGSAAMATAGGSRRAPVPGPRLGLPLAAHLPASLGREGAKDSLGGALAGRPSVWFPSLVSPSSYTLLLRPLSP